MASFPSFPGPRFWLRDPGAPREERDQPGLLREPGREPAGDGAGQRVPAGADPHRQPPALVRLASLRSPQTPSGGKNTRGRPPPNPRFYRRPPRLLLRPSQHPAAAPVFPYFSPPFLPSPALGFVLFGEERGTPGKGEILNNWELLCLGQAALGSPAGTKLPAETLHKGAHFPGKKQNNSRTQSRLL